MTETVSKGKQRKRHYMVTLSKNGSLFVEYRGPDKNRAATVAESLLKQNDEVEIFKLASFRTIKNSHLVARLPKGAI
jgi:hypothetical protein